MSILRPIQDIHHAASRGVGGPHQAARRLCQHFFLPRKNRLQKTYSTEQLLQNQKSLGRKDELSRGC